MKSIERVGKSLTYGVSMDCLSAAPPEKYAERFTRFVDKELLDFWLIDLLM